MLNVNTKDDQLKELQFKTEKPNHEYFLNSLKNDNDFYRKKYKRLDGKKIRKNTTEIKKG